MSQKTSREIFTAPNVPLPENFIPQLPDTFGTAGEIIHNARNQIRVFDVGGQKVNVKKFCIPPIVNRVLYSWGWRIPKAKKTFLNAQEILKRGFQTPTPYGYILERDGWLLNVSYFVSEQVPNKKPIREAGFDKNLITALAHYTAKMHESGLMHKDFTPGNVLYSEENGKYEFCLVDINRFRCEKKPIALWLVVQNLMQPFYEDACIKFFVEEYAKVRGLSPKIYFPVWLMRRWRNFYDRTKRTLKKFPGVSLFLGKSLSKRP
jgi:hypothetical protein